MKKTLNVCDFCDNKETIHIAKTQCAFCGKWMCGGGISACRGKPSGGFPKYMKNVYPAICEECWELMKYKTVIDRTFSSNIADEADKLIKGQTEKELERLKAKIYKVFEKLLLAGKKNKEIDNRAAKRKQKEIPEREKTTYIPF